MLKALVKPLTVNRPNSWNEGAVPLCSATGVVSSLAVKTSVLKKSVSTGVARCVLVGSRHTKYLVPAAMLTMSISYRDSSSEMSGFWKNRTVAETDEVPADSTVAEAIWKTPKLIRYLASASSTLGSARP